MKTLFATLIAAALLLAAPVHAAPTYVQLTQTGLKAVTKKDWPAASAALRAAIEAGAPDPELWAVLARAQASQDQAAAALDSLQRGASAGLRITQWLEREEFSAARALPGWAPMAAQVEANAARYRREHNHPDAARFVTSDISQFWRVYDRLAQAEDGAELIEREYLLTGSPGLQDFVLNRIASGKNLLRVLNSMPRYYSAIRPTTEQMGRMEPAVRAALHKFRALYEDAEFPDMYFVVGAANSGGTSTSAGLIMGVEMFSRSDSTPTEELSPWLLGVTKSPALLQNIVLHELMHFQQRNKVDDLLSHAIHEGGADFLASLVSEGNFNEGTYRYGYAHEDALKREFAQAMAANDDKAWFGSSSMQGERPSDLGYFIGFRICQAYYAQAKDKRQAIRDILHVRDARAFLAASAYL
ncbi:hypothetical protein [Massilia sp. TS11]|uniref:hypothetical protein n=1 Tax=Massilia sp. TS11 TaxID=2908003 RepID=UPI001EDAB3BE|nr:hypothetical protein [Massilia sp. TS11]MCG2585420.1 hypothetical protein [Massilia sp. TS11]